VVLYCRRTDFPRRQTTTRLNITFTIERSKKRKRQPSSSHRIVCAVHILYRRRAFNVRRDYHRRHRTRCVRFISISIRYMSKSRVSRFCRFTFTPDLKNTDFVRRRTKKCTISTRVLN